MELFGWADKYPLKVHIAIGLLFFAFATVFGALMALDIGKGGDGLWFFPLFAFFGGAIILWRAKDRIQQGDD
ncbi:MAG: hypothetical protein ACE5FA_12160 [Dehalococcoidia bacterium]